MTKDKVLKLALEALEAGDWYINQLEMIVYCVDDDGTHENRAKVQAAITAIKEALAPTSIQCEVQDEQSSSQEPVAFVDRKFGASCVGWHKSELPPDGTQLYTTPPKRPWVGLNDKEIEKCYETTGHRQTLRLQDRFAVFSLARAVQIKLKEKNT